MKKERTIKPLSNNLHIYLSNLIEKEQFCGINVRSAKVQESKRFEYNVSFYAMNNPKTKRYLNLCYTTMN